MYLISAIIKATTLSDMFNLINRIIIVKFKDDKIVVR